MAWTFASQSLPEPQGYRLDERWVTVTHTSLAGTTRVQRLASGKVRSHILVWENLTSAGYTTLKTAFDAGPVGTLVGTPPNAAAVNESCYWETNDWDLRTDGLRTVEVTFRSVAPA